MKSTVRIAELKARLSEHLRAVRRGRTVTVLDRETPIARIVPYPEPRRRLAVSNPSMPWSEARRLPPMQPLPSAVDALSALLEERQGHR